MHKIDSFTSELTATGNIILPEGFKSASIVVSSGSYNITDGQGKVSPVMSSNYTFSQLPKGEKYKQQIITWISGTILITKTYKRATKGTKVFHNFAEYKSQCEAGKLLEAIIINDENNSGNPSKYVNYNGVTYYVPLIVTTY